MTFSWSLVSQSIANNTSTINYQLVGSGDSPAYYVMAGNFKLWANGGIRYDSADRIQLRGGTVITSGTLTIPHNADGSKSFSANAEAGLYDVAVNTWGSGTWALPQIPRAATLETASGFTDEGTPSIGYKNPAGSAVTSLQAAIYAGSTAVAAYRNVSKTGGNSQGVISYSFSLTPTERLLIQSLTANSNSLTVEYRLRTNIGGVDYTNTKTAIVTIVNASPTFGGFSYVDTNATVVAVTGSDQVIVKNRSSVRATVAAADRMTTLKSATPVRYAATLDSRTANVNYSASADVQMNLGTILNAGQKRFSVRAFDSRGNSAEHFTDVMVLDYAPPTINATAERLNNFEAQTTIKVNGEYNPLVVSGTSKNNLVTARYRYREFNGSYGGWASLSVTLDQNESTYICSNAVVNLDISKSFEIEIEVADRLSVSVLDGLIVDTGVPVLYIASNQKAIGINCVPPLNAPAGSIWSNGANIANPLPACPFPVGSIYTSINSANPNTLWPGTTWTAHAPGRVLVGVGTNGTTNYPTVSATGGADAVTLSAAQIPSHSHGVLGGWGAGGLGNSYFRVDTNNPTNAWSNTGNTGGGGSHENRMPYTTVYMWRRTA